MKAENDKSWFNAQLEPKKYSGKFSLQVPIQLPELPPDDVQLRFTGKKSRSNLEEAANFYTFIRRHCMDGWHPNKRVLDFGGGWGRVARFFLRDSLPENISIADCLEDAIYWLGKTKNPCNIIHNDIKPPLFSHSATSKIKFDLIYAYSVFSHLSEEYFNLWMDHFRELLVENGRIVFTSRGLRYIKFMESFENLPQSNRPAVAEFLPSSEEVSEKYKSGEFQFYPHGGGGELTENFYGEAFIPPQYFEQTARRLGFARFKHYDNLQNADQTVFILH